MAISWTVVIVSSPGMLTFRREGLPRIDGAVVFSKTFGSGSSSTVLDPPGVIESLSFTGKSVNFRGSAG